MLYLKVKKELDVFLGCDVVLERPKNKDFGHFSTPIAFMLAKSERKNPKVLSEEIAQKLRTSSFFAKVETLNGYINLTLAPKLLNEALELILRDDFASEIPKRERKILLEYVSANPTGPLHIGHARGAIYGDALLRLGRFSGYEMESEYYINDAGAQISMLGLSILLSGRESLGLCVEYPEQYYRGEYIDEIAQKALKTLGEQCFKDEDIMLLAEFGKDLMLEEIKQNLAALGIEFDSYVSEKSLYQRWNQVFQRLQDRGGVYGLEGKMWLKSSEHKDEKDRVIVRENGEPTYLAGDIIYHEDKFLRPFDHYINIWGADHHGYIARVKSSIEFLGFDSTKLEVLLSQMVKLLKDGEPYKMSKRAGNFILMQDVVDEIGSDALRFVFLSKSPDIGLEFELNDLQKQDGSNPIFYINYANARIHTLIEKSGKSLEEIKKIPLNEVPCEIAHLLFLATQVSSTAVSAFEDRAPLKLCDFLKNLASEFHAFYNANKILGIPHQDEILKVLLAVSASLEKGLELLGIKAKQKM